ncbi:CYTH and CHAD domain-containing protein [Blastococcus sp. CT_GayMR16]|uniref:CYTH and CHAD domain-containing protein n=1 Tax=Blastococcus sp. CT_GayMR16 TaxID=2559607 RepID=UPI001431A638|nr:CYTH and CHAD domain-containing protein [Blastococcus sp. CT_GayMR16]
MLRVHREVEKKYVADDGFELPPLMELVAGADALSAAAVTPVAEGDRVEQQLVATYFDTADLRLAAAGLTLRRRTGGDDAGWHLKVPAGADARSEVRLPLGRGARTVPAALRQMVWAHSLGAELRPVAEILTDRTVRRLVDVTGHAVAEVADDRVTARRLLPTDGPGDAAGAPTSWREIEVELDDATSDLLAAVDIRLRERGLQVAPTASKLAHVLDLQSKVRDGSGKAKKLKVSSPGGEVVLAHIREQVQQIVAQDLPVRLDAPDSIHKMRVATRRLRSALTTFKPLFAADVVRPLRDELKWLAGELGAARDAEVMRDRVRAAVEEQGDAAELGAVAEIAHAELDQAYASAHDRVIAELDGQRYHDLLMTLDRLVTSPPVTGKAAAAAGRVLPRQVARSYEGVRRIIEDADSKPAGPEREELLHDARKSAKRSRYAGESVSRVFGEDAIVFAKAMEDVQEALGEHQDSVLTRERLADLAAHTSSTGAAFLYGRLHALEEIRSAKSQQHFDAAWKAAGRTSVHRWLH